VTTVDLDRLETASTTRFRAVPTSGFMYGIGPSAAISPNGRMLAFVTARRLWLMDTAFGLVRGPTRIRDVVHGVGFTANGRRVIVIGVRHTVAFDAATGRRL
jgi:hypothetical protein